MIKILQFFKKKKCNHQYILRMRTLKGQWWTHVCNECGQPLAEINPRYKHGNN